MNTQQSALIGFAVLRANYNADAPNYIDNFTGFAVDVLVRNYPRSLDAHSISGDIGRAFGLSIPALVVEKILQSAMRLKLAEGDRSSYTASPRALKQSTSLTSVIQRYARQQTELATTFSAFVREAYPEHAGLLERDAAAELGLYFQAHTIPLLAQSCAAQPWLRTSWRQASIT